MGELARIILKVNPALGLALCVSGLAACATTGMQDAGVFATRPAHGASRSRVVAGGRQVVGKPYQVKGVWYEPKEQPSYDQTGIASWYGEQFQNLATANGEIFDLNRPSAAHKTLPLPSLVEVTNLDNGRKLVVRVNDRGPFVAGRIIDLSRAAAIELGYERQGTAHVRVRYLGPANGKAPARVQAAATPAPYTPQVAAATMTATAGDYQVQVGAFANKAGAERVALKVAQAGQVDLRESQGVGGKLYRVVLIGLRGPAEAEAARAKVAGFGFADARVVRGS